MNSITSMSPRVAAVDPHQQTTAPPLPQPRIAHMSREQIDAHPHGLLLVLAQYVLSGLQPATPPARELPPYSADPDAFARQMDVFERMRETNRKAKRGAP
jgi:hypothetical protein